MRALRLKSAKSDGDSEVKKIERLVRLHITQGLVPSPNYRLSARKLAKELKVSRDTTWRALCLLAGEQWVQIGRHGGFQVHPSHWPDRKHLPICRVAFLAEGDGKISGSLFSALYAELAAVAPEHRLEISPVCVPFPQSLDPSLLAGFDVVVLTASWARTFSPITESLHIRTIGLECGLRDHVANAIRTDFFRGGEILGPAVKVAMIAMTPRISMRVKPPGRPVVAGTFLPDDSPEIHISGECRMAKNLTRGHPLHRGTFDTTAVFGLILFPEENPGKSKALFRRGGSRNSTVSRQNVIGEDLSINRQCRRRGGCGIGQLDRVRQLSKTIERDPRQFSLADRAAVQIDVAIGVNRHAQPAMIV